MPKRQPGNWSALIRGSVQGGLSGHTGASLWFGGTIGLERKLIKGLSGRLMLSAFGGPIGKDKAVKADAWALEPGVGILYLWTLGKLSLGPVIELGAWWSSLSLKTGLGPTQTFSEWLFKASIALELRWQRNRREGMRFRGGGAFHGARGGGGGRRR